MNRNNGIPTPLLYGYIDMLDERYIYIYIIVLYIFYMNGLMKNLPLLQTMAMIVDALTC